MTLRALLQFAVLGMLFSSCGENKLKSSAIDAHSSKLSDDSKTKAAAVAVQEAHAGLEKPLPVETVAPSLPSNVEVKIVPIATEVPVVTATVVPEIVKVEPTVQATAVSTPVATQTPTPAPEIVADLAEADVTQFFTDKCGACHGMKKDNTPAPFRSSWQMPNAVTRSALLVSSVSLDVYQALFNKIVTNPSSRPSGMPLMEISATDRLLQKDVIKWFQKNLPTVVTDAQQKYGMPSSQDTQYVFEFKCNNPVNLRTFVARLTSSAFDRPPTLEELATLPKKELDKPVTKEQRTQLVDKLFNGETWSQEFKKVGLRKLASVIGGAPAMTEYPGQDKELLTDLKEEFYQLTAKHYNEWSYKEYFTTNMVMTSARTAPRYGCYNPSETEWKECEMPKPREGFFSTLGFLNSRRTNFMTENNNYGRVSMMYFTLLGETLTPSFNGPKGDDAIAPIPDCLEQIDTRKFQGAPRGTVAIPRFGNVCQSCHLGRNLAAGSILFRKYSMTGAVYDSLSFDKADSTFFQNASSVDWTTPQKNAEGVETEKQVDRAFLANLLTTQVKACVSTGDATKPYSVVNNTNELAMGFVRNEDNLVRGLMHHAQRVYSNLEQVNFDTIYPATLSYRNGKNKLSDLLPLYFSSESYACSAEAQ